MSYQIVSLSHDHNAGIAEVIRCVSDEYGLTADKGFSVADPELDRLSQVYAEANSAYWVVLDANQVVVGGAGIAPLAGHDKVCELQKMYLLPRARGQGIALKLSTMCFDKAKALGFETCYLETTACLSSALHLYQKLDFKLLDERWGDSGHNDCEICMALSLK